MIAPSDLKYTSDHEWIRLDGDVATVGITDHAQAELSDVVFIELPDMDREVEPSDPIAVVESVKAASDIYAPLYGQITEINEELVTDPSKINTDPYGVGWIFKMKVTNLEAAGELMDAGAYSEMVG